MCTFCSPCHYENFVEREQTLHQQIRKTLAILSDVRSYFAASSSSHSATNHTLARNKYLCDVLWCIYTVVFSIVKKYSRTNAKRLITFNYMRKGVYKLDTRVFISHQFIDAIYHHLRTVTLLIRSRYIPSLLSSAHILMYRINRLLELAF